MAVQEVEQTEVKEEKPLEDLTVEELQQMHDQLAEGETSHEPEADASAEDAETIENSENPDENVDSNDATTSEESQADIIKAMRKEMDGLQKLVARSQTELGLLRKQKETLQQNQQEVEEIDPYVDPDKYFEKKLNERESNKALQQQQEALKLQETKDYVEAVIPNFGDMITDMSDELNTLLKDEPERDVYVSNFKANPYVVDPLTLMFAGRTAELKRELNALKGKLSNSANGKGDLINKINKLGRSKPTISGGSHGSTNGKVGDALTSSQIENMPLDQLERLYKQQLEQ